MSFPSRRALYAFARILASRTEIYQCPRCTLSQVAQQNGTLRRWTETRQLSTSRKMQKEYTHIDDYEGSLIDFQLANRAEDGSKIPVQPPIVDPAIQQALHNRGRPVDNLEELEQVKVGLQMTQMSIEGLEDVLMDANPPEVPFLGQDTLEGDHQPWYSRQYGDISEDEYTSIDALLKSKTKDSRPRVHQSEIMYDNLSQDNIDMTPWYLRDQESDTSLVPKIDIQQTQFEKYPDLPYDSPPFLQPLVSRLFYDHHLQNIVLLDLRNRDPPPIWGNNTIMILANVRSERQLSGVAEATSKWLKTTVGVQPRVDGLPKRESIIIKRRRLRRKSLRKPGYLIAAPRPITWVSMHTGYQGVILQLFTEQGRKEYDLEGLWGDTRVVDAGVLDMKPRKMRPGGIEEDERIETTRPSMGQKKPLWQKKEEKERKKWEKMKEAKAAKRRWTREEKEQARQRRLQENSRPGFWEKLPRSKPFPGRRDTMDHQQRRQFHVSVPRQHEVVLDGIPEEVVLEGRPDEYQVFAIPRGEGEKPGIAGDRILPVHHQMKTVPSDTPPKKQVAWWSESKLPQMTDTVLPASVYDQLLDALRNQPPFTSRDTATESIARIIAVQSDRKIAEKLSNLCASNDPPSLRLLAHFGNLVRFRRKLPEDEHEKELHLHTFTMDPFPEKGFIWAFDFFMRDMPIRPNAHHWRLAVLFYLHLNTCSHRYHIRRILDILLLPVSQGISVPVSTFHVILNHVAMERPNNRTIKNTSQDELKHDQHQRIRVMSTIIKDMKSDFGHEYRYDEEVYLALYKACSQPFPSISELISDIEKPLVHHHMEYFRMLLKFYYDQQLPMTPEFLMLELMAFAHQHKWRSFLKRWNWTKATGIERDGDLWTVFWGLLARGQNEYYVRLSLRDHFPEMLDEQSSMVWSRNIAIALERCLEIADPHKREYEDQRRATQRIFESFE